MTREIVRRVATEVYAGGFTVPSRLDEDALKWLKALSVLRGGTGWALAAVVYALTYDTGGGRPRKSDEESPLLTISGFADLGLRGLKSRDTVRKYRQSWKHAIRQGWAEEVEPGDFVRLPDRPFEVGGDDGADDGPRQTIKVHFRCAADLRGFVKLVRPLLDDGGVTIEGLPTLEDEARSLSRFARHYLRLSPESQKLFERYLAQRKQRAVDLPIDPVWGSECDKALICAHGGATGEHLHRINSEIERRGLAKKSGNTRRGDGRPEAPHREPKSADLGRETGHADGAPEPYAAEPYATVREGQ